MGEFKDGSLKSGGSGRKVTNPKQAIAIALSEANRMNQGGIVGLAQMQSPFANSIRPRRQTTMGPGSYKTGIIGDQRIPPVASPMQRNFMQMQNQMRGMQQNPLELYQGYLGQKYIGPMAEEQQNKINQFVGAVSQAERQAFGQQQGGKTFGGRLQPGMPGSGLMPPMNMNQAPAVMPGGYSDRAAEFDPADMARFDALRTQGPALMNQGGMMYSDIMNRPMFQTPQQRQGMGIMAGVAPVRGYEDGGEATPEYTPKFMREEEPSFFSLEKTEPGSGINLRDLTDLFIVDPEDPEDRAIAAATIPLMAFPPAAIAARLANAGYKASKVIKAARKASELQERMPGFFGKGTSRAKTYGQAQGIRTIEDVGEMAMDAAMGNEAENFARGGIASLPVIEMTLGGEIVKGLFDFVTTYGSRGLDFIKENLQQLNPRQAEQIVDQAKKADKVLGEAGAETVEQGQRLVLKKPKMQAEDLATPPESAMPTPPKPPAKVADEVTEAAEEAAKKKPSVKRQVATGTAKAAGIAGGAGVASDIGLGTNFISTGLEKIGDTYGAVRDDVAATLEMPEIVALRERVNPDTGERVELTESVMEQVDLNKDGKISDEERKAIKEKADKAVAGQQKPDTETGTGTPKPEATGIMKFLFGKDGIGGDPGAVGKTMDYLADPRTRYALARAAESRPGVVDRNFFTDFTLGQAEYDQLQGKDETALMQNYEFLKAAGKSDDEIFNLLLSKDTESDLMDTYRDAVLTLYKEADENPNNTGVDRDDLLKQAQMRAAQIVFGTQSSAPQDSEVVQTVELE